jgi:predicted PurR-regulated permease PerM
MVSLGPGVRFAILTLGFLAGTIALYLGRAVFEPLVFALFIIALTGPFMQRMQQRLGKGPALLITLALTLLVLFLFLVIVSFGVMQIANWVIANMPRFQQVYAEVKQQLADQQFPMDRIFPSQWEPGWLLGPIAALFSQLRLISGFALLVFVFVVLGLTELDGMQRRLARIEAERPGMVIGAVARDVSTKFGLYMRVRLVISLIDAGVCYLFFRLIGLEEPLAWAILVGTMNFIPFIGPLLVAVAIGVFAAAQFGSLWMVLLAVGGTTAINFILGSYIEPLMAGSKLAMSAMLVLFAVFFWSIIWGIPGAFIGVQIMVVVLSICAHTPSTRWIAELFSGDGAEAAKPTRQG